MAHFVLCTGTHTWRFWGVNYRGLVTCFVHVGLWFSDSIIMDYGLTVCDYDFHVLG